MNALVLQNYNNLEYTQLDAPKYGPDEVLVRVRAVGICGSDVHGIDGSTGRRIPPLVMGHEAAGVIEELGDAVAGYEVGDRVTFDSTLSCGRCRYCRRGMINFCENRRVLGVACDEYSQPGAFAEYVRIPARVLYRLPDEVDFHAGAMVEPLSIAVHAAAITPIAIGDNALVIGAGVIGLLTLQVLQRAGCGTVYVADIDDERLAMAKTMGAAETFNSRTVRLPDEIVERTDGLGVDSAFDAVGLSETTNAAIYSLRKGGTATIIGNFSPTAELPLQYLVTRQIRIQGSNASAGEYRSCIEMIRQRRIDVTSLISKVAPLSEGARWIDTLYQGGSGLFKVILEP
ncbi:MAG: galactitol-1-phosphate 5-dehydrogenase [Spirochaetales bacterium]|nr:galactitol-1-phosphate 5-dehydrogenase [Spirochaetales bacterium]